MRRRQQTAAPDPSEIEHLLAADAGELDLEARVARVRQLVASSPERADAVLRSILQHCLDMGTDLAQLGRSFTELQSMHQELLEPPWYPATYLRGVGAGNGDRALVWLAGGHRVVPLGPDVDPAALAAGDEVYVGTQRNAIVGHSPGVRPRCGETATFERLEADGRLVVRWRDEELVIDAAATLPVAELRAGDQVRWNRDVWMAFERLQRASARRYLLDEAAQVQRASIGGQDAAIEIVLGALTARLLRPETAARYGDDGRQTILMCGPPGCGKTSIARLAAAELERLGGRRCLFAVVKPAEWEAPYVGETQQNIRDCFRALRDEAAGDMAVLFLDEIEAVGRVRGSHAGHHSDKALAALLAELDGFSRSAIAVIAATNRKDLVDPALLERLSDVELRIERPDLDAARSILHIHLPEGLPYAGGGAAAHQTRELIVETALSRLYGPNAGNELCCLRFRDGASRTVAARELASGRLLEQICRAARRRALWRDIGGGAAGIDVGDIEEACEDALERLATNLHRGNVHAYLDDLPQDLDVVAVDALPRRPARPHRYLVADDGVAA